jgi:hypothetical protein
MAYNVPTYDTSRFSFGPGVLYLGAPGLTPEVDIGAVKGGAELSVERTKLEVKQGSPQTLVEQYVIEEKVMLKVTGIEWNFDNLSYLLGAGATTGIGSYQEKFEFGGAMTVNNRALRFVHRTPDGSTVDVHIFKAQGSGKIAITFNEADMHEFPFEFSALEGTTDFEAAALAANKKMFKIIRTKA